MTLSVSTPTETAVEWQLLAAFRSHRHRLQDSIGYMPLDVTATQATIAQFDRQNQSDFLEDALRRIMRRDDNLSYLDNGKKLGAGITAKAEALLQALWAVLEDMVDVELVQRSQIPTNTSFGNRQYFKLSALLGVLGATTWNFGMISQMPVTLFQSNDVRVIKKANTAANNFISFLDRQTMSSVRDFPTPLAPEEGPGDEKADASAVERGVKMLRDAVNILCSNLKTPPHCEQDHKVLMQLRSLEEATSSGGQVSEPALLELFLSSCRRVPSEPPGLCWTESLLRLSGHGFTDKDIDLWWRKASRLCDEIHKSVLRRKGLLLAAPAQEIHVFEGRVDPRPATKRPTWRKKPSKTLKQLMRDLAFVEYYTPARGAVAFTKEEKQDLAAKLVSSFVVFHGSDYIVKSWDPESIYFLAEQSRDDCLRTHPYAMLAEQLTSTISEATTAVSDDPEARNFRLLARLLIEIRYGHDLTNVLKRNDDDDDDDDDGIDGHRGQKTLQDVICEAMSNDLSPGEMAYLSAVEDCLEYQDRCRSLSRVLEQRKHPGDAAAAARRLTHSNIIRGLRGLRPLSSTPTSAQQPAAEVWEFAADSLQISSASGQLGLDFDMTISTAACTFYGSSIPAVGLCHDLAGQEDYIKLRRFFSQIKQFQQESKEFIRRAAVAGRRSKPARIAILDTGVDRSHGAIVAGVLGKRLQEAGCMSWVDGPEPGEGFSAVRDTDGHGTNTIDLLLRVAPQDAQIFVAKVFSKREFTVQEATNIAKAINHAVHKWGADVVTMSFGLEKPTKQNGLGVVWTEIETAINNAPNTIFLAAAGNHGRNAGRAFPAKQHNVICMHASDGNGSEGDISPLPQGSDDNFMTLGMNIDFNVLVEQKRKTVYRSGTSYATPVAAGLVALLLPVLNAMDLDERARMKAQTGEGMQEIFRLMSKSAPDRYRFVAPAAKLWTPGWHLDDKRMQKIECDINDALP